MPPWMWLAFLLGPALGCALAAGMRIGASTGTILREGMVGLAAGLLLVAGLALAGRFFAGRAARLTGALAFAALLAVSGAAIGFAGCFPYPYIHTVRPVRAAPVPGAKTRTRADGRPTPTPTPPPTPHTEVELRIWPN